MKYTAPRGTRDITWPEIRYWQYIELIAAEIFKKYNYTEIRTPIIEQTELFTKGIGQQTDIVSKEMYNFQDKGGRNITLRPEGTASVVRACIQDNLISPHEITKLYYLGPMFRYERPQAGRYRQFHQIGAEAIGSPNPLIDAEMIIIGIRLFERLGISGITVHVNSLGCQVCRPVIQEQLKSFIEINLPNLCEDCQERFYRNPMRIIDCKNPKCQKFFSGLPSSSKVLCQECKDHFNFVLEYLEAAKVDFIVDPNLVRGLDYYTKTVFEIRSDALGAQNALCGGGRYDNLIKELGGNNVPAIGFAFGVERTVLAMMEKNIKLPEMNQPNVFVIALGHFAQIRGFIILQFLRDHGLTGEIEVEQRSISAQMKRANKLNVRKTIIIGDDEIANGYVTIKNMKTGEQQKIELQNEAILAEIITE
ncbi:MAG: histidine--tRNA ligase [Candidatus Margulisiibacteriota bacterium]|nr:MAG: histidine--tRNA ligase [Candidatus Margulisbacteria bacterium GWD2_39_127]PZM84987.1 MAG: histidine--tRNA ligase [Candidatus Margulisiibacteriota bacterium]HAR63193.1 histidine--tRNA ligase [Candidatus Margulisiibacteriota bacterium]HCY37855.1 histidine--tRNA ligase [Candidatus Margulisiibacteriota bacterium]